MTTSTSSARAAAIDEAVARLQRAAATRTPCAPVRDLVGSDDVDLSYTVQRRLAAARLSAGARVVGHKIGLTNPAVQAQLGVDRPDFGLLFDDMDATDGVVDIGRLLQPRIEAEIAFVLGADIIAPNVDASVVGQSVAYAVPALEIVDSRIANWDITFGDTVADNASSGLFVLGSTRLTLDKLEPADVEMTMTLDCALVASGSGAACLGDPLNALAWLARTAIANGDPLRAGHLVLSGALGPMVAVEPGSEFQAEISGLGTISATFTEGAA